MLNYNEYTKDKLIGVIEDLQDEVEDVREEIKDLKSEISLREEEIFMAEDAFTDLGFNYKSIKNPSLYDRDKYQILIELFKTKTLEQLQNLK